MEVCSDIFELWIWLFASICTITGVIDSFSRFFDFVLRLMFVAWFSIDWEENFSSATWCLSLDVIEFFIEEWFNFDESYIFLDCFGMLSFFDEFLENYL